MSLKDRLRIASENQIGHVCIDTAIFLATGIKPKDKNLGLPKPELLERFGMKRLPIPEIGSVAQFVYETYSGIGARVAHMGVVVETTPRIRIAHRINGSPRIRVDDFDEFSQKNYEGYEVQYYALPACA